MTDPGEAGQPDNTGGSMLALYPPRKLAKALAVPEGLPAGEIHLTVAYTGDAADVDPEALKSVAQALAWREPVKAVISGHARFTGGDTDVIVALADSAALENLRRDALDRLSAQGIAVPRDHSYCPHLTIRYADKDDADPVGRLPAVPAEFAGIAAVHGKTRTDYPFSAEPPIAAQAREAYLAGWALSDGPLTARVRAGCAAAVETALEHRHDPGILEATLELGKLEGTWATVYDRRHGLLAKHLKTIIAAWDACMADLDPRDVVKRFRREAYLAAEAADPQQRQWWQDAAKSAALGWLYAVYRSDGYQALVAALEDAIRDGMAEGEAGALALAASRQGKTGFAIAAAFAAAYERLADDHSITQRAQDAAAKIIDGAAADVGRRLARMAGDDAGEDEMTAAVQDVTTGDDARSASTWADWALYAAIGAGALGLYQRVAAAIGDLLQGTVQIDWITAGGNVCPICLENEMGSPYSPDTLPPFPGHPRCRCSTQSRTRFPLSFLAPFLP